MEATRYPSGTTPTIPIVTSSSTTVSPAIVPVEVSVEATRHPTEVSPATTAARSAPVSSAVVSSKTQLSQHKAQGVAQCKQQDQWKTKDPRHQERRTDLPRSRDQRRDPRDRDRDLDRGRPKHQDYDRPCHSRRPYVPSRDRQDNRYSRPEKRQRRSLEDIRVQVPAVPAVRVVYLDVQLLGVEQNSDKNMPCLLIYQECFTRKLRVKNGGLEANHPMASWCISDFTRPCHLSGQYGPSDRP